MLTNEIISDIEKQIKKDIEYEFELINKEINFFLSQNFDIYFLKEFIRHYPPKAIRDRAEVLVETLLNYFMKDLIENIKKLPTEKQYLFFKEGLREKIKEKTLKEINKLIPVSLSLSEDKDFKKKFPIIGSIVLTTGGITTAIVIPESLVIKSIPAASSLLASLYLLKNYKNQTIRLKKKWKRDVEKFLEQTKEIIKNCLENAKKELIFEINRIYSTLFVEESLQQSSQSISEPSNKISVF